MNKLAEATFETQETDDMTQYSTPPITRKRTNATYTEILQGEETTQVTQQSTTSPLTHNRSAQATNKQIEDLVNQIQQTSAQLKALEESHKAIQKDTEQRLHDLEEASKKNVLLMKEMNDNIGSMAQSNKDILLRFTKLTTKLDAIIPSPPNSPLRKQARRDNIQQE